MDSQHDDQHDEHQGPDSPPEGARATDNGGPAVGPQVIATDDPSINSEFAYLSDPKGDPDQAMVIEASTSRIRESHGSIIPRVYTGVVEHVRPPHERSDSGKRQQEGKKSGEEKGARTRPGTGRARQEGRGQTQAGPQARSRRIRRPRRGPAGPAGQAPSLTRILLFSGLVSLVFGMIGGWSYSYFFGSSQSDDQQGSDQGSGSSKKSDSSDKGSDKGSDSAVRFGLRQGVPQARPGVGAEDRRRGGREGR